MPTFFMLIGVPGSGKSTLIKNGFFGKSSVLSTDDILEEEASKVGKTYSEYFSPETYKAAEIELKNRLALAIKNNEDIVWDQTNTTKKSRASKIALIPNHYRKIAVFLKIPKDLKERLLSRTGKEIPENVMKTMMDNMQEPSHDEGFDYIHHIGT